MLARDVLYRLVMNDTTNTETNPLYQLNVGERETLLRMASKLSKADREELTVTGMWVAWETEQAKWIISWRGRE